MKQDPLLVWKMTFGIFGILTTELGVVGILPLIATQFNVSVSEVGWLVSIFALGVAIAGPVTPVLFAKRNQKHAMLLVQGVFVISNLIAMVTSNFAVLMLSRLIPALFHPIYCAAAFTVAANSVKSSDAPKAISKVMIGVSAGMVFGVPITSMIANVASFQTAMGFFATVNFLAFLVTLLTVPSLPPQEKTTSYLSQLKNLSKVSTWVSLATVALIAASMASVYSYVADYLQKITMVSPAFLTLVLLTFGLASIFGNPAAGRALSTKPMQTVTLFPFILAAIYIALYFLGTSSYFVLGLAVVWGVVYGAGNNFQQYWISSSLPDAPELATGLFLSFGNVGITLGTFTGGMFITNMGVHSIIYGGLGLLVITYLSIMWRRKLMKGKMSHTEVIA